MRDHPPDKKNPCDGADRHQHHAGNGILEASIQIFDNTDIPEKINAKKLQRRFGLLYSTACAVAELAYAGLPK